MAAKRLNFNPINLTVLAAFLLSTNSCSLFEEDQSHAQNLLKNKQFSEAIEHLSSKKSKSSMNLLAHAYIENGVELLKNKEDTNRYENAKKQFEKALDIDPKNTTAKDFYQMIIKLQIYEQQ